MTVVTVVTTMTAVTAVQLILRKLNRHYHHTPRVQTEQHFLTHYLFAFIVFKMDVTLDSQMELQIT